VYQNELIGDPSFRIIFGIMALEAVFVQVRTVFPLTARIIFLPILFQMPSVRILHSKRSI
jgi:hypothetical protein